MSPNTVLLLQSDDLHPWFKTSPEEPGGCWRPRRRFMLHGEEWTVFSLGGCAAEYLRSSLKYYETVKVSCFLQAEWLRWRGWGGGGGLKQQRCFTLQYSDDTSDIFIDSNKGQTTKAESKIEENTSRKTADLVRHGESAFQWQRLNAQNNATPSRPGFADSPLSALSARLPSFRSLPGTFLPQQSKRYPGRREYLEKYLLWQSCRQLRSWSYNFNPRGQT